MRLKLYSKKKYISPGAQPYSIFLQILIGVRLSTWNPVPMFSRFESEKYYKDPNKNNATYPFPFMEEEGSIDLSVIVPSYNEEERRTYT